MLQSLDIAKLIRHGRMLPLPHRLLNDYLMSKIPLRDCDCSAFFDYAHLVLIKTTAPSRHSAEEASYFTHIIDMFERLLATKLPPSEVGPKTHAAMIRCCAHLGKFEEGYEWFRQRAISTRIEHTIELYDSIIELCEKCEKNDIAWDEFEKLLKENNRVPPITLCRMLRIAANQGNYKKGREIWELFDFFYHKKNGNTYEAGLDWLSECSGKGREALNMITEMRQLADKEHLESIHQAKSSCPKYNEGTYDRFSSRIIHNNQGSSSSGISLYNPENYSYSNNHSIAEYESKAFLRSLHPTVGMTLNVLYCLIKTDSQTYKLAWNFFQEEFLDEKALASKPSGRNIPSMFVSYEPLIYMFYGAYLHTDFEIAMQLMHVVTSDPKFSDINIAPQALFYWVGTIRKYFESERRKTVAAKTIASNVAVQSSPVENVSEISSFHKLRSLYEKCQANTEDSLVGQREASSVENHGAVLNRKYETIVYEVPYTFPDLSEPSKRKCSVIADVVEGNGSPFQKFLEEFQGEDHHELEASLLGFPSDESAETFSGIPEMIERSIKHTERKTPRSAYGEWIYTEYIGALSSFPWTTSLESSADGPSFLSGLRKMLSTVQFLMSKDYPINTRIIFYMIQLLRNHTIKVCQVSQRVSSPKNEDVVNSNYGTYAQELYQNLEEVFQLIAGHQSAIHFVSCDKIRHEVYFCLDFFEWLDKRIDPKYNVKSFRTSLEQKWQSMTKKSGKIFHRNPGVVIDHLSYKDKDHGHVERVSVMPTCNIPSKDLDFQRKQWTKYQNDLWGYEPESPPAPRRSERITSFLSFSREDKALCKLGQRVASPKTQSSF